MILVSDTNVHVCLLALLLTATQGSYHSFTAWKIQGFASCAGIKRSASGEAASASAKKQKTTPLATYQQAQEHLRAQMARQVHLCIQHEHPSFTISVAGLN